MSETAKPTPTATSEGPYVLRHDGIYNKHGLVADTNDFVAPETWCRLLNEAAGAASRTPDPNYDHLVFKDCTFTPEPDAREAVEWVNQALKYLDKGFNICPGSEAHFTLREIITSRTAPKETQP